MINLEEKSKSPARILSQFSGKKAFQYTMKFTAGQWKMQEGIVPFWAAHTFKVTTNSPTASAASSSEASHTPSSSSSTAPASAATPAEPSTDATIRLMLCKPYTRRGDSLDTSTLTVTISSPAEDVISVKSVHWAGSIRKGPQFALSTDTTSSANVSRSGSQVTLTTGALSATVETADNAFTLDFLGPDNKRLTGHGPRSLGYMKDITTHPPTEGMYRGHTGYMTANLDLGVGELLYGLGERFGPFVKNGQVVDCWNEDGGTSSELAYKNIPFYLSSRGYGILVRHAGRVSFELQSERTTRVNISVEDEALEYLIFRGDTPKEVLSRYVALTGRAPLPPSWSYGLWLTTSFTTDYDEKTVTGFLDGLAERDIPLSVFHFDCFWMKGFEWCNFEFDNDMFPDAAGYLTRLRKEKGLRLCLWINPYIGQESRLFTEAAEKGYLLRRTDDTIWQIDQWQSGMAIVDFTNPSAWKWYQGYLSKLIDLGVESFKTDFGERIPFKNVKWHDSSHPELMHNYYTQLYNQCVQEILDSKLGKGKSCLFARSATVGGQTMPVHWGGDCESTYPAMAETLRGGLSLGLSGFAYWAHDIGGFEGLPSADIYKRWVAFGLMGSHSRLHGSTSYRVPWLYDEEACDVLKKFTKLKISLAPYLFAAAVEARDKGTPVLRAMLLELPEDRNVWTLDQQYMLGPGLLVAPVFNKEGNVSFYVPQEEGDGEWRGFFTGERYQGGRWYEEKHGFTTLPVLVRPNTLILRNRKLKLPDGDIKEGLEVIYGDITKDEVSVDVFDAEGSMLGKVVAKKSADGEITVEGNGLSVESHAI